MKNKSLSNPARSVMDVVQVQAGTEPQGRGFEFYIIESFCFPSVAFAVFIFLVRGWRFF